MKIKALVAVILALACLLCACGVTQRSITGTWKHQQTVLGVVTETTYEFNDDGTGAVTAVVRVEFTYALEGDQLTITTTVLGISDTETYTVSMDGGVLLLTQGQDTMRLERVK